MDKSIFYRLIFFLAVVPFLTTCLDEYNPPEITNSETVLVVEGNISDTETRIRLTQTSNLSEDELIEVNNARVILENENGGFSVELTPESKGFYGVTVPLDNADKYRIQIQTEGNVYASEYLALLPTPTIDSVGWESVDDRFQVHISTRGDENSSRYYLWSFEETWLYRSRLPSNFIYEDNMVVPRPRDEQINTCWSTEKSTSILIGTTINLSQNVVSKLPLHVIEPTQNLKLSNRYSILVKQYAISKEAFEFWDLLKKNSESLGTFFDPQPSQLPTNLTCISNPEKAVIGFVAASQEQQERIFVNRSDLPFRNIPFATVSFCERDTIANSPQALQDKFASGTNLITFEIINMFSGQVVGYEGVTRSCADCRVFGGTNQEPDFWNN